MLCCLSIIAGKHTDPDHREFSVLYLVCRRYAFQIWFVIMWLFVLTWKPLAVLMTFPAPLRPHVERAVPRFSNATPLDSLISDALTLKTHMQTPLTFSQESA